MSKHTPGPWSQHGHFPCLIVGSAGSLVARSDTTDFERDRSVENEANARLIAAAPELLEAAKAYLAKKTGRAPLDAAIAKAEGRS